MIGLFLPTNYSVNRSIIIDAKPAAIHEYVGDLKKWREWEPWTEQDPTIIITYGDKTSGIGANQAWIGKDGDGQLILTSSSPAKGIKYDLFFDDGKYECKSAIAYEPIEEGKTKVTWSMEGSVDKPIIGGYFALIMGSMTGLAFERGLEKLKKQVEE
jgi:hypothetical protein